MDAQWKIELEALQQLLARQQSQINILEKQLGAPADDAEEMDLPAAEYRRVFAVTVAFIVYTNASMLASSFTAGGIEGNLSQLEYLVWPLCWTLAFGLVLGTLDSSKAGRRAIQLTRGWLFSQVVFVPLLYWTSGQKEDALGFVFVFLLNAIYWPWLAKGMRETLCTKYRGTLTTQAQLYTNRCLKVLGFQVLLAITAAAQGINGRKTYTRIYAYFVFSVALGTTWVLLVAIFDVCNVDSRDASKLRLTPLQAAALASCGLYVLNGLAGYVIAGQRKPSRGAANAVGYMMVFTGFLSMAVVGRLVAVARRRPDVPPAASSVKPVDALGSLDLPGA